MEEPPPGIRAQVPVNIRAEDEHGDVGNRVTSLFVELPTEEADAVERLKRVSKRAAQLKTSSQATGGTAIAKLTDIGPPLFGILVARSMFGNDRIFNLTITNVPGPQKELKALGATLVEALPFVPLFALHTIGIAIASYNGNLTIGVSADRHNAPDIDVLAEGLEQAFAELQARCADDALRLAATQPTTEGMRRLLLGALTLASASAAPTTANAAGTPAFAPATTVTALGESSDSNAQVVMDPTYGVTVVWAQADLIRAAHRDPGGTW